LPFSELRPTTAGVEASTKLTSKDAVDDEVDGRIGRHQQIADVVVVEVHLGTYTRAHTENISIFRMTRVLASD